MHVKQATCLLGTLNVNLDGMVVMAASGAITRYGKSPVARRKGSAAASSRGRVPPGNPGTGCGVPYVFVERRRHRFFTPADPYSCHCSHSSLVDNSDWVKVCHRGGIARLKVHSWDSPTVAAEVIGDD
jgi:hypothetical protein